MSLLMAGGTATAVTFDFNSLTPGSYTEGSLSSLFSGVSFNNTGGDGFTVYDSTTLASGLLQLDFTGNVLLNDAYGAPGNSTIASFDYTTDFASVTLGDLNQDYDDLYLFAYDSSNALLDSDYFANPAGSYAGTTLSVSSLAGDIAWVEYYGVGTNYNSVFWDNLSFNMTEQPVPEPVTFFLFGAGLLGLAGFRRKFRK